jgi:arsenite/tail-anchored protein-transporting ATPase
VVRGGVASEQAETTLTTMNDDRSPSPFGLSTRYLFFTGKGGVGKTTLACATALALADAGKRVLLVSTDPASNLDEMLGPPLSSAPTPVPGAPGLFAANIDPERAADDYRTRVLTPYEGKVSEAELATMREELSGACTTEIAAFDRFAGFLAGDDAGFDHVVFDTAPTGHTLRLLDLAHAWTSFLEQNTRGASCLGPHGGLTTRQERFEDARRALVDVARTTVVLVTRPERAALAEAARTSAELRALGLVSQRLIVNGVFVARAKDDAMAVALERRGKSALDTMPEALRTLPRADVPLRPFEMLGLDALRAVMRDGPVTEAAPPTGAAPALPRLDALIDELASLERGLIMVMGKGGVGKTTVAAAIAVELASRGLDVHLSTTDPAAHVAGTVEGALEHLEISRIDPAAETKAYVERIVATKGKNLDADGRALLLEDLRSPCTEEVAVFHAFAQHVFEAKRKIVVLDTAPTGHTLLLLDATGAYHRDFLRGMDERSRSRTITPLMMLRDPAFARILLVTVGETTPVSEAERLAGDLRRAGIEPWAWVLNASLAAAGTHDLLLTARVAAELRQIERVRALAPRLALVPWKATEPRGVDALRQLVRA